MGLLLVNIAIEMTLPQVKRTITGLRNHWPMAWRFHPAVRAAVPGARLGARRRRFVLGPVRNRAIQKTLGDIRAALATRCNGWPSPIAPTPGELISRATTDGACRIFSPACC